MMNKFEVAVLEAKETALNTEVWVSVYEELERQRDWNLSYVHDADGNVTDERELPDPENDNEWNGYPYRKYQMYQEILQFVERKIMSK